MTILESRRKTLARPNSYAISSGQATQTHWPDLYSLEMNYPSGVSSPCVPVSTTGNPCPEHETGEVFGQEARVSRVLDAMDVLIDEGFIVGCDGELLPPRWLNRLVLES